MSKPLRVLMVEDSEDDALLTIRALTKGGYEPVYQRVETAEAMRNALREKTWDVILCDYRLPQFSGFAAIVLLKDIGIDLPLIIVSSTIGEETAADCMRYGARDWVTKSNLSRLVPAIERELKEAESRIKRRRAEEALQRSKAFSDNIIEHSPHAMWISDDKGTLIRLNQACCDLLHIKADEVVGEYNVLQDKIVVEQGYLPLVKRVFEQGETARFTLEYDSERLKNLELMERVSIVLDVTISPVLDAGGRVLHAIIQHIDITDRKRAEETLRRTEENFRRSLDESPLGVGIVSEEGELLYANRMILDFFGYESIEELREKPFTKRYTELSYAEFLDRKEKRRLHADDDSSNYEIDIVRKDGEIRHLQVWRKMIFWNSKEHYQVIYQDITERKRMEIALQKSEESFRAVTENAYDGIIIAVRTGAHIYANKRASEITGYSVEELLKIRMKELAHPDEIPKLSEMLKKRIEGEEVPIRYETTIVHKEGKTVPIELTGAKTFWHGQVAVIVIFRDITERKRAEETLRRSEENFRHSLDDSPMGVRIVTEEGETIYANRAVLDIYGYDSMEDLKTIPVKTRYTPESHADFLIRREKRQRGVDVPSEYTINIIRKDGETRYLLVLRREILWNGERQFQVLYSDITERSRIEKNLRESEEILRYIIEHDPNAIAVYDRNLRYIAVSKRYLQDYDVKDSDIIGKHHYEVFPEMPQKWKDVHARCLTGAIERNDDDYFERPDGSITYNRWECRPWHRSDGEIGGIITYTEVTTERKHAEEELRTSRLQLRALYKRLQQIREDERLLVAREIHDEMGGGLTGLKMDLSWLLRKLSDDDLSVARVALIDKIHTAKALIDQMIREVRRISSALRPSVLDDLGLIAALEWQLSEFTSRTAIPHEFATTCEYINIEKATAVAVFRIFQEALTNVVRHSRATKVVVDLREGERSLFGEESFVLEIRDNGRGIKEEEILHPESLGLLGMKERVLAFGGEISMRGEPGGGTVLILQIPQKQGETS